KTLCALDDRVLDRARRPSESFSCLVGLSGDLLAEVCGHRADAGIESRHCTDDRVGDPAARDLAGVVAEAVSKDLGDLGHPQEWTCSDEPLAAGVRRRHRRDLELGDVTYIHEAEPEAR